MITVNGEKKPWKEGMTIRSFVDSFGYNIAQPYLLILVNSETVQRSLWETYLIPDEADIKMVSMLRGG